jgi:hypothetical protein
LNTGHLDVSDDRAAPGMVDSEVARRHRQAASVVPKAGIPWAIPAMAVDVAVIRREFTSAADARRQGAVPGFGRFSRLATDVVF